MKHKHRKTLLIVFAIICLILAGIALYTYVAYQKVTAIKNLDVTLLEISAGEFTWTSFTLGIALNVYNPNDIDVKVGNFTARAFANNIQVASVQLPEPVPIAKHTAVQKIFNLKINYLDAGAVLLQAIKDKQVFWRVQGEYDVQLPLGLTYPFTFDVQRAWNPNSS
jgi:LEA14-like dessication related protein